MASEQNKLLYGKIRCYDILGHTFTQKDIWKVLGITKASWWENISRYGFENYLKQVEQLMSQIPKEEFEQIVKEISEQHEIDKKEYFKRREIMTATINGTTKTLFGWGNELGIDSKNLRYFYRMYGPSYVQEYIARIIGGEQPRHYCNLFTVFGEKKHLKTWCKMYKISKSKPIEIARWSKKGAEKFLTQRILQKKDEEIMSLPELTAEEYFAAL